MNVVFSPEVESRLREIASHAGEPADELVRKIVAAYVEHADWFEAEVKSGMASLDAGESLAHEAMGQEIARLFRR